MAGPVKLNASRIKPPSNIAYKDAQGKWRAGPDADPSKVDAGGNITDVAYAKKARGLRRHSNMIKNIMREANEGEGVSEDEARDIAKDVRNRLADAEDEEERRDIWREYVNS